MQKKRIIVIAIVAVVAVAGYFAIRSWQGNNSGMIRVSGNIELTEVTIGFKTAGRLMERAVNEGATVKKGVVVARLDRDQLQHQREMQAAALASAQAQLAQRSEERRVGKECRL